MEEWKEYKLGDIISIAGGFAYKGNLIGKGDNYLLGMGCVSFAENFLDKGARKYDGDCPERYHAKPGDIVLATRQQSDNLPILGMPAIIPSKYEGHKMIIGANLYRVVIKDTSFDNRYLYWLLKTPAYVSHIRSCQSGTTVRMITKSNIEDFVFCAPNQKSRNAISDFIWALDDKIELNRRINANLEAQAQALFKSWFVDFEPFRDGEFVESELGMIPKGWRVGSLSEFAEISKSSVNPQKQPQTAFVHYSIPSYDDGMKPEIQLGEEIKSNKFVIANKMTLFSKLNPRIKRVWYVDNLSPNSVCSTEFVPYKAKEEALSSFIHGLINSQGFYDFVMAMVNGATGSHQRFHPEDSLKYQIAYNNDYIKDYCLLANPILNQILTNNEESRRLAALRDTLLPRLMSGEIKVGDVTL